VSFVALIQWVGIYAIRRARSESIPCSMTLAPSVLLRLANTKTVNVLCVKFSFSIGLSTSSIH
jgi:hypothetical protein